MERDTALAITDYSEAGQVERLDRSKLADVLGPGLITGASDDDPSGIATYAQAGAAFGFALSWTLLLTYPLMARSRISAEIGRVTARRRRQPRRYYPRSLLYAGSRSCSPMSSTSEPTRAMGAALQLHSRLARGSMSRRSPFSSCSSKCSCAMRVMSRCCAG